jgi:hypothetical protein
MARMSIDDMFRRDPRLARLAKLCGWSRRETRGAVEDVWSLCYDRVVPYLPREDIETAALEDAIAPPVCGSFVDAMIEVGLARKATPKDATCVRADGTRLPWRDTRTRDRVYIAGTTERLAYLISRRESGAVGGRNSGQKRRGRAKHTFENHEAPGNPPDPVPDSAPDSVPDGVGVPDRDDPATAVAELAARLAPTHPPELDVSMDWQPRASAENRIAATAAQKRGVLVEYARRKFVERARAKGWSLVDLEPRWRECLLSEFPTPPEIRDAFTREQRELVEREARDRERAQRTDNDSRAEADRPAVLRALKAANETPGYVPKATNKATA